MSNWDWEWVCIEPDCSFRGTKEEARQHEEETGHECIADDQDVEW